MELHSRPATPESRLCILSDRRKYKKYGRRPSLYTKRLKNYIRKVGSTLQRMKGIRGPLIATAFKLLGWKGIGRK